MMYTDDALMDLLEEFNPGADIYSSVERDLQAVQAYLDTRPLRQRAQQAAKRLFELSINDDYEDDDDDFIS